MEVVIEDGGTSDLATIQAEFEILEGVATGLGVSINQVIVPVDFDATVNRIQGSSGYTSQREHVAIAKVIAREGVITIILSPFLFTEAFDTFMRLELYLHELSHASNNGRYPSHDGLSQTRQRLLHNIITLYDDYYANRMAFVAMEAVFPEKSPQYIRSREASIEQHLDYLAEASGRHQMIQRAVTAFRQHSDVRRFCDEVYELFDASAKSLVYLYSYIDSLPTCCSGLEGRVATSPFCNGAARSLIQAFRRMYQDKDFNFMPHLDLMQDYLEVFGMRFEDRGEGEYLHVLDV